MRVLASGLMDWQGWFLLTLVVAIFVQRATYIYCAAEWLRWAPQKARDVVLQARHDVLEAVQKQRRLEAENAKLRGRLWAIRQAAEELRPLRLVEWDN